MINWWLKSIVRATLLLLPLTAFAQGTWLERTQHKLDSLCNLPLFTESQLGLCILDLSDGTQVYQCGARQRMRPASTMKVVTAVTAMSTVMGHPDCFALRCWSEAVQTPQKQTRHDLILVGGMDPLLEYSSLCALADSLVAAKLTTVNNIWLDVTLADTTRWGEGWCWDDDIKALTPFLYHSKEDAKTKNLAPKVWSRLPEKPFTDNLRKALRSRNIKVNGRISRCMTRKAPITAKRVTRGTVVDGKKFVARIAHSWDEVLKPMMKESDNLHAESMLRQLGLLGNKACPKVKDIRVHFDSLCVRLGLDYEMYRIADGSGLSLYNYVTPELLCRLLNHAALQPWFEQFRNSLPLMGVDGTLKQRCKLTSAHKNVWAKTGSVTGVASLAGYAISSEGHLLCFAIINQGLKRAAIGRDFQDAVCIVMTE